MSKKKMWDTKIPSLRERKKTWPKGWSEKMPADGKFFWAIDLIYDPLRYVEADETGKPLRPLSDYVELVMVYNKQVYRIMYEWQRDDKTKKLKKGNWRTALKPILSTYGKDRFLFGPEITEPK
jgi:hypothetical protein